MIAAVLRLGGKTQARVCESVRSATRGSSRAYVACAIKEMVRQKGMQIRAHLKIVLSSIVPSTFSLND
jgi:hypothetical protein